MPKSKPGGYHWAQDIVQIRNANRRIRQLVRKLLGQRPGEQGYHNLLTEIALETGASDDALDDLRVISER